MPIPLHRLPQLASIEVLRTMEPKELFCISVLSQRSKHLVKWSMPKNKLHLAFWYKNHLMIEIGNLKINNNFSFAEKKGYRKFKIGDQFIWLKYDSKSLDLYWSSLKPSITNKHISNLVKHLCYIFNKPTVSLKISQNDGKWTGFVVDEEFVLSHIELVKDLPIKSFTLLGFDKVSGRGYTRILNFCASIPEVSLAVTLPDRFRYRAARPDLFKNDDLVVSGSHQWMKLEDFMGCRYVELSKVNRSDFKPEYLNWFFKKLMDSETRLEFFHMKFDATNFNFRPIVDGLGIIQHQEDKEFVVVETNGRRVVIYRHQEDLMWWWTKE